MAANRRGLREAAALLVLFALLMAFAAFYEQVGQERVASNEPTTANPLGDGARAFFLLCEREGLRTQSFRLPWTDLTSRVGILVFIEPPSSDRPLDANDLRILEKWIRDGGTLLDVVSDPPIEQPLDPSNAITGDSGATSGDEEPHEAPIASSADSSVLNGVRTLAIRSRVRLVLGQKSPYTLLARDESGAVAAEKPLGKGRVFLYANRYGASNSGIGQADNALFLVNICRRAASGDRSVAFDDYHHGVGFAASGAGANSSLWENTPLPLRLSFVYLAALGLLLVYNGNRRFGPARAAKTVSVRTSTDYVNSMARLYRRAGAADIAFETLYGRFILDLRRTLEARGDMSVPQLARTAAQKFGPAADGIEALLQRGESVAAGLRLSESDMLNLAQQIEQFRRKCHIVGV